MNKMNKVLKNRKRLRDCKQKSSYSLANQRIHQCGCEKCSAASKVGPEYVADLIKGVEVYLKASFS